MKRPQPRTRRGFSRTNRNAHRASFDSASVHHVLTASLRGNSDLARWVRSLLDADLAAAAAWPSETAVRVAYRHRKQARSIRKHSSLITRWEDITKTRSWKGALAFAMRHPRFGIPYLRGKWLSEKAAPRVEEFAETKSSTSLVKLIFFHPFVTLWHVVPKLRFSFGKEEEEIEGPRDFSGTEQSMGDLEAETDPDEIDALEMLAEAERVYLDLQIVAAAIRQSDSNLFGGPDRDGDGFVRLMLRESYHEFVLPGSEERHQVTFEPRLLLHESGVAQIDLALSVETPMEVRQVLAMMWGPEPMFVRSEMSTPLIRGTYWESLADFSEGTLDAGQPLGVIDHPAPVSIQDLLHLHLTAVLKIIKRSYTYWTSYPVAIVGPSRCCRPDEWQQNHREDLIRLTMRSSHDEEIADNVLLPQDLSLSRNHSLFAQLGSALYLQWKGSPPKGIQELDAVLVLEYALLVYVRLHALEEDVSRMVVGERRLRAKYRSAVRLFSELRVRDLRSGEARDIVRHVFDHYGIPEMRRTIETALSLSSSAYSTRSAELGTRRAWWITFVATLIGLVVAFPPLRELLSSVPASEPGEAWPLTPLRWLAGQGFWGPWLALAGLLIAVFVLWVLGWLWRWRIRRIPSFRRGYKWPTEFKVSDDSFSPAADSPQRTELVAELSDELARLQR